MEFSLSVKDLDGSHDKLQRFHDGYTLHFLTKTRNLIVNHMKWLSDVDLIGVVGVVILSNCLLTFANLTKSSYTIYFYFPFFSSVRRFACSFWSRSYVVLEIDPSL